MMADHQKILRLLKTARGQLDGIINLVVDDRACTEIYTQVMATEAILKRCNREILAAHLEHCVKDAVTDEDRQQKVDELVDTLGRLLK